MNTNQEVIKKSLEDKVVEGLKVLSPRYIEIVEKLLINEKDEFYLGEWNDGLFSVKYVYRIHSKEMAAELMKIIAAGHKIKKPTLIKLYSKEELMKLITYSDYNN